MLKFTQIALGHRPVTYEKGGGGGGEQPTETTQTIVNQPWGPLGQMLRGTPGTPEVIPQFMEQPEQFIGGTGVGWEDGEQVYNRQQVNPEWDIWSELSQGGTVPAFTPGRAAMPGSPGLFPAAAEWFSGSSPEYYPGQMRADVDPRQYMAQNMGLGATGLAIEQGGGTYGAGQDLQKLFMDRLRSGGGYSDPGLQTRMDTVESRAMDFFNENVDPRLRAGGIASGQAFGGSRQDVMRSKALEDLQENVMQQQGQMLSTDYQNQLQYQSDQDRTMAAMFGLAPSTLGYAGTAGNLPGLFGQQAQQVGDIGMFARGEEQAGIDLSRQEFDWMQNRELMKMQQYAQLLASQNLPMNTTTTGTYQGGQPGGGGSSTMGNALGGAMMGASAFAPFATSAMAAGPLAPGAASALVGMGPVGWGIGGALLASQLL